MTGYGTGQASCENALVKAELRSVNHRFFDVQTRISRDFVGFEARVKELLGARISRGRVTATIDVEVENGGNTLTLDVGLADQYRGILSTLEKKFGAQRPDAVAFAQLPDLVRRDTPTISTEAVGAALKEAIAAALDQLIAMRRKEGEALALDLAERIGRIGGYLEEIEDASKGESEKVRDRLQERIANLVPEGSSPDPERLATEVAILADKADVVEELVRFRAHNEAFLEFLSRGEAVGKRLDFLLQEMNREVNTIGSKSMSAEIAHLVVDVKEEIERLREQVQNIE